MAGDIRALLALMDRLHPLLEDDHILGQPSRLEEQEDAADAAAVSAAEPNNAGAGTLPRVTAEALYPAAPDALMSAYRKVRGGEWPPRLTAAEIKATASAMARIMTAVPPVALAKIVARVQSGFPTNGEQA